MDALIGHTGFVGGHLASQHRFDGLFNSRNIAEIGRSAWRTVVCAAAPGSMFEANRSPQTDLEKIDALIAQLQQVRAERFVLISSIAVLADFAGRDDETTTRFQDQLAYGRHRRRLESFCQSRFATCLIVRLPALFGSGLRKNFIFDLLNPMPTMLTADRIAALSDRLGPDDAALLGRIYGVDPATGMQKIDRAALRQSAGRAALERQVVEHGFSATQFHNPETTYQYYDMARLWTDLEIARQAGLEILHLAMPPLRAADIHQRLLGRAMPQTGARLHHEDMRTVHAPLWDRTGPYLDDASAVMARLSEVFEAEVAAR